MTKIEGAISLPDVYMYIVNKNIFLEIQGDGYTVSGNTNTNTSTHTMGR